MREVSHQVKILRYNAQNYCLLLIKKRLYVFLFLKKYIKRVIMVI